MSARWDAIRTLRRTRQKSRFLRLTAAVLVLLAAGAWLSGEIRVDDLWTPRRRANLERFLTREAVPYPLQQDGFSFAGLARWVAGVWRAGGGEATWATLWIAVAAIVLAGAFALVVAPLTARNLATARPFDLQGGPRGRGWRALTGTTRVGCVVLRAVPEYVLAFFLASMLHGNAWPAVLALAIHNGGILGRLYGDTVENLPPQAPRALRTLGAERGHLYALAAVPMALPRFLLYFFYRFETCVREATVLGMLGIASLGALISEARMRFFYDEMLLLVGFGIVIVLVGDLASHLARGWLRRAR